MLAETAQRCTAAAGWVWNKNHEFSLLFLLQSTMLPGGSVVKHLIVLSGERLANLFILRIQSHGGDVSERGSFLKIYLTMLYSTKNVKINQQISMRRFKYYNEIGRK